MKAKCLCQSIEVNFEVSEKHFKACHCGMCRGWGSGPYLGVTAHSIVITGSESLTLYNSSDWAQRGFCSQCGTHLFYRLKDESFYSMALGAIESGEDFKFKTQIYTDHKPAYYDFQNSTEMLSEAQVLALFQVE